MDGTILILDYSEFEREKTKYALDRVGNFEIIEIASANQYYTSAVKFDNLSLIIMDIALPSEKEGLKILDLLRKNSNTKCVPIIINTKLDSVELRDKIQKYNVNDFVVRPYQINRLEDSIRSAVNVNKKFIYSISSSNEYTMSFENYIERELKLSSRLRQPLSIILITPPKPANEDSWQEEIPASIMEKIYSIAVGIAKDSLRATDTTILNDNGDILIVLPGTAAEGAKVVSDKLKLNITDGLEKININFDNYFYPVHVTYPEEGMDFQSLMISAIIKVSNKEMLEKIVSIPLITRKNANKRYNQFKRYF